jgi:hypothetical protein
MTKLSNLMLYIFSFTNDSIISLLYIFHDHICLQINCGCMFWRVFFAMGHLIGLSPKTLWNISFPKKNYMILYNHINVLVLRSHLKPYKIINFYTIFHDLK